MKRLALFGLLILAAGCGSPKPIAGLVTAKKFEPSYTWVYMMPMSDGNGGTSYIPIVMYEPDRWVLTVEPYDKDGNPQQTVRVLVTPEAFEAAKLGAWFQQTNENTDARKARKVPKEEAQ